MKLRFFLLVLVLGTGFADAQGTFVVDQQSTNIVDGAIFLSQQPAGQSFIPMLSSIALIEIQLFDRNYPDSGPGATISINLHSGSINGTLLGTTESIDLPANSFGTYDFFFNTPIAVSPGTPYYFQPVESGGGDFGTEITFLQYAGGDAVQSGVSRTDRDLWFREGIVSTVPEPSLAALLLADLSREFCIEKDLADVEEMPETILKNRYIGTWEFFVKLCPLSAM